MASLKQDVESSFRLEKTLRQVCELNLLHTGTHISILPCNHTQRKRTKQLGKDILRMCSAWHLNVPVHPHLARAMGLQQSGEHRSHSDTELEKCS